MKKTTLVQKVLPSVSNKISSCWLLLVITVILSLAGCTQTLTDPSFGGKVSINHVEEESSRPVAHMYKNAGDRWVAILWSIEEVDGKFRAEESRKASIKWQNGIIAEEKLLEFLNEMEEHVGCLALTIRHIEEANRILREQRYTLEDRKDRRKSFDIFTVYCSVYNPTYETNQAIYLLRPNADSWYKLEVASELVSYINF